VSTTPENWAKIKELFQEALELSAAERPVLLRKKSPDATVRDEVERLLAEHDRAGNYLSAPALEEIVAGNEARRSFREGDVVADRFKIDRFIAAGGMGEVYEAEDLDLREHVAIKTILPSALRDAKSASRFRREVQLARRVTHPNVCRLFDLFRQKAEGQEHESLFVSMELLHGETLTDRLKKSGRLEIQEALSLLLQVASGLAAAHEVGVIHGDLKPGNIVLIDPALTRSRLRAVIADFGLAVPAFDMNSALLKVFSTVSSDGSLYGTPAYMAPEQLEGNRPTAASDVYAFGLVAYEMVTGVRPFAEQNFALLIEAMLNRKPQTPSILNKELSAEFDALVLKALEKNPAMRYATACELLEDFKRLNTSAASNAGG
jgi:eukaryotic-like serine/threonine-protein kinase